MSFIEQTKWTRRTAVAAGAGLVLQLPNRASAKPPTERRLAVTIDDGPASGAGDDLNLYRSICDGIRKAFVAENVPAIMFINERQLHVHGQRDARVELIEQWLEAALELGNHTYSHRRLNAQDVPAFQDDIIKGEVISRELLRSRGQQLKWFRYPYLATERGPAAAEAEAFLAARDYSIAPVTVDYKDYSFASSYSRMLRAGDTAGAEEQFESVLRAVDHAFEQSEQQSQEVLGYELPQILLIHCNQMNALTLPAVLARMRARGYTFISLEQAMQDPAYHTAGLPPGSLGGMFLGALARHRAR